MTFIGFFLGGGEGEGVCVCVCGGGGFIERNFAFQIWLELALQKLHGTLS